MRLTRRGAVVILIIAGAFVVGSTFGGRVWDVVVVSGAVVTVVGLVQLWLLERPMVERSALPPGYPGENRTVNLDISNGTTGLISLTDRFGSGIAPETVQRNLTGDDERVAYDIKLDRRGVHNVGPLTIRVRDSLGVFATEYRYTGFDPVIVYPSVRPLTSPGEIALLAETHSSVERSAFDQLREYVPGDSLRDIHWPKSASKSGDELYVVEYAHGMEESVSIAAEATGGANTDRMARATASILTYLLERGIDVELTVPNGSIELSGDRGPMEALLLLAKTTPGRVSTEVIEAADVYILGDHRQALINIDGEPIPFADLIESERVIA